MSGTAGQWRPGRGLRIAVPSVEGRGAGLGNELFVWAKAWLAAQAIDGTALAPSFGLNPRAYWCDRIDQCSFEAGRLGPT